MDKRYKELIDKLLNHDVSKGEAMDELLFLCDVSSSIKVGDIVQTLGYGAYGWEETKMPVLEVNETKALCKLQNGLENWYHKSYLRRE